MFDIKAIRMPDGAGPAFPDRLFVASVNGVLTAAAANSLGTTGAVTAGTGYTMPPTILPTGGTINPAVSSGGQVTTPAGWPAVIRATMKVVGVPTVGAGGSGFVTSDTVAFGNGVILTAATVVGGAVTVWSVSAAGNFVGPGGMPLNAVPMISTSGVGVGATANLTWGINTALVDDSGNYSVIPTGFSVTPVDGNGTSGAVAAGAAAGAGAPVFRSIGPFTNDGIPTIAGAPVFGAYATWSPAALASPNMVVGLAQKVQGYAVLRIQPPIAANSATAGSLDALIFA